MSTAKYTRIQVAKCREKGIAITAGGTTKIVSENEPLFNFRCGVNVLRPAKDLIVGDLIVGRVKDYIARLYPIQKIEARA